MLNNANILTRSVITTAIRSQIRNSSHGGIPGENLPFSIHNKYRLTALFAVFFGSGLAAPYLVLRHQLLKK